MGQRQHRQRQRQLSKTLKVAHNAASTVRERAREAAGQSACAMCTPAYVRVRMCKCAWPCLQACSKGARVTCSVSCVVCRR